MNNKTFNNITIGSIINIQFRYYNKNIDNRCEKVKVHYVEEIGNTIRISYKNKDFNHTIIIDKNETEAIFHKDRKVNDFENPYVCNWEYKITVE